MATFTILTRGFNSVFPSAMDRAILLAGGEIEQTLRIDPVFGDLSVQVSDLQEVFPPTASANHANFCDPSVCKPLAYRVTVKGQAEKNKDIIQFCRENEKYIFGVRE